MNPPSAVRRASVVAFGLGGLALSIAGAIRAVDPVDQLRDVIGFSAVTLTAAFVLLDRWRRPALLFVLGFAVAMTAASAVARWSLQYALAGTTSMTFFLSTAVAVMLLPSVADEVHAAIARACAARPSEATARAAGAGAVVVGLWLLVAPAAFIDATAAMHAHLVGAFVVAIGALTLSRVGRTCRWGNAAIGAWLLVAPLLYGYGLRGAIHAVIVGITLLMVSVTLAEPEENLV